MSTPASPELRRGLCFLCIQAIQKETSGHFENALLAVLQATCFPPRYFAQVFTPCTHLGVLDCHWGLTHSKRIRDMQDLDSNHTVNESNCWDKIYHNQHAFCSVAFSIFNNQGKYLWKWTSCHLQSHNPYVLLSAISGAASIHWILITHTCIGCTGALQINDLGRDRWQLIDPGYYYLSRNWHALHQGRIFKYVQQDSRAYDCRRYIWKLQAFPSYPCGWCLVYRPRALV